VVNCVQAVEKPQRVKWKSMPLISVADFVFRLKGDWLLQPLISDNDHEIKMDVLKHLYSHIHKKLQEYRATEMKVLITIGGMILVVTG
jgi:hypothetical protein